MNEEWVIDKLTNASSSGGTIPVDDESELPSFCIGVVGGATWGSITGDISSQTDLQTSLNAKIDKAQGSASLTFGSDENGLYVDVEETV